MTDEEFAKSIGATPVSSSSDDDFAKSIGATKIDPSALDQLNAGVGAVGDFILGGPKFVASSAMGLAARAATAVQGKKGITLKDTMDEASKMVEEAVPSYQRQDIGAYKVPMYPLQKLAQGTKYLGDKAGEITGNGDVAGGVEFGANLAAIPLGLKVLGKGAKAFKNAKVEAPKVDVTPEDIGAIPIPPDVLANQSPLSQGAGAFDNIRRQTSGEINPSQDITNTPMERVTDSLLNGKDQAAVEGSKNADANSIVTNYWKERAEQMQAEEAGMRDANAQDVRDQATQPDQMAQRPMAVNDLGNAADAHTMDALSRSTEGISYENVPPDGVIPRNSPNAGLEVPRGNSWPVDENGIPVRQGLPTSTPDLSPAATERGMRAQDVEARNDLGNAIQEANGPKLGPDEHYGAGRPDVAQTPSQPFNNLINKPYKNSQRGSSGMHEDLVDLVQRGLKRLISGTRVETNRGIGRVVGTKTLLISDTKALESRLRAAGEQASQPLLGGQESNMDATRIRTQIAHDKVLENWKKDPVKTTMVAHVVEYPDGTVRTAAPSDIKNIFTGPGRSQRGSAPMFDEAVNAAADLVRKAGEAFSKAGGKLVRMLPEDHMSKVSGQDMIYKPESGDKALAKSLAQGPMETHLWKNVQSGLALAAEKTGSVALAHVGNWLNWADKRTHFDNRTTVDPVNKLLRKLPSIDFQSLHTLMMDEQSTGIRLSDGDLATTLKPKAVEAYKVLRRALDDAWNRNVATSKEIGKNPGTREEAYHASMHYGDFKQSFYDKSGKLVWHVSSLDKMAQLKAEAYIKKNIKNIDWEKSKPYFGPDSTGVNVPKDIMSAYQNMMKFFDPTDPTTTLISDSINKYNQEHGFTNRGFNERFLDKSNIPGFEGNKPWLSPKENARAFMDAQVKYLRDSNHWNNLQEALGEMKPVLSNETLIKTQPNIMATAAAHVSRELGITGNKLSALEASLAKITGYVPGVPKVGIIDGKPTIAYGVSRGNVYKGVADVKTGTYLTMLGMNVPYMITTPLQAVMAVAQHRALTLKGFDHNVARTTINSLQDVAGGLAKHFMSSMTGKDVAVPMSDIGKRMLKYAEDNGIIDKTVMDETGGSRSHAILDPVKKTLGQTITAPEKIARFSTFISFAHHLVDSGKLSEAEAFHMAEDFTNHSLTSMRRADKPLVVDKLGTAGQLGYVFKSYLFNEYNQLSQFAGLAKKGSISPLMLHLGTLFALGGALALPGVNELDGAYDLWKNGVAMKRPQNYSPDIGIKGAILRDLPTWASIGTASSVTGSNLGTRFNTQVTNVNNPLSDVAVPIQEGREIMSLSDWAFDPTMRNALQALHANVGSTLKGQMETRLDSYKNINKETSDGRNPNGTMSYLKPNNINSISTDYKRTPTDESKRAIGMYSDTEYKTKQLRYSNNKEEERVFGAYNKLANLAMRAGTDGDTKRAQALASKALELIPDRDKLSSTLNNLAQDKGFTPEERDVVAAQNNMMALQKIVRLKSVNH